MFVVDKKMIWQIVFRSPRFYVCVGVVILALVAVVVAVLKF